MAKGKEKTKKNVKKQTSRTTSRPKAKPATKKKATSSTKKKSSSSKAKAKKKSSKVTDKERRSEFRVNKDSGHPTYIYQRVGRNYKYIGITHSKITKGSKNIKLEKNPNPNDKSTAYIKSYPQKAKTKRFKNKLQGWKLSKKDKSKVEKVKKRGK